MIERLHAARKITRHRHPHVPYCFSSFPLAQTFYMPRLSQQKEEKIKEQILYYLFSKFPKQLFTVEVATEIARDEEFVKRLLLELEKKQLVVKVSKNPLGINYSRRTRWRISNKAHEAYSLHQNK